MKIEIEPKEKQAIEIPCLMQHRNQTTLIVLFVDRRNAIVIQSGTPQYELFHTEAIDINEFEPYNGVIKLSN